MSAIVTGAGLGVFNANFLSQGNTGQHSLGQANHQYSVNAATGNLIIQSVDETVVSQGADLGILRTYNSQGELGGGHGQDRWRLGFLSDLQITGTVGNASSTIIRTTADGFEQSFRFKDGVYQSKEGNGAHDIIRIAANNSLV